MLGVRIEPSLAAKVRLLAERDHRTVSAYVRKLLIEKVSEEVRE